MEAELQQLLGGEYDAGNALLDEIMSVVKPDMLQLHGSETPERVAAYSQLASQFGDAKFLTEEEREASRAQIMAEHVQGTELWVFGYGSLMWNPAIHVDQSLPAHVEGFQRSFCMRLMFGRGMPDNPGLMLCLVPGGTCAGIAHRIAPEHVESESKILWMREMLSGAYVPTWIDIDLGHRRVDGEARWAPASLRRGRCGAPVVTAGISRPVQLTQMFLLCSYGCPSGTSHAPAC